VTRAHRIAILATVLFVQAAPQTLFGQAPSLNRQQRAALQAVVQAVDRAATAVPADNWSLHTLRASDGSHYVAFSVLDPPGLVPQQPVVLYLRLATRQKDRTAAERSAVAEWLAGQRAMPLRRERAIAFGDMPTFGAGAIANRGPGPQSLSLLEMERERAREKRETSDRERKATLEGAGAPRGPSPLLPFEDFDLRALASVDKDGGPVLRRSLTTGPGEYDLIVGWVDPAAKDLAAAVRVVRRPITLEPALTSEFALSSVIVADQVGVRDTPFPAGEQTAHPYAIGTIDIVPARDHELTNDERLSLIVQVVNPRPAADGKPDVVVGFRIFRLTSTGQESVGTLTPQSYNQSTLPPDFDAAKGHPIFAAVAVPLRTFRRGTYRVQVMADDRLAGVSTTTDARFTIVATPAALLRDAPPLGAAFRRDALLESGIVDALVSQWSSAVPSTALATALQAVRDRRFIELVRDDSVTPQEAGARTTLRALALYALGDSASAISAILRQARQQSAPPGPLQVLEGATRALEGNDRDAIAAWRAAIETGVDAAALTPVIVNAFLRVGDAAGAHAAASLALAGKSGDALLTRCLAAAALAGDRPADAIALLDPAVRARPDDVEAHWLLLQAHYSGFARGQGPGSDHEGRSRITALAERYVALKGVHATLASEWAASVK
jgi:hypothetical protein